MDNTRQKAYNCLVQSHPLPTRLVRLIRSSSCRESEKELSSGVSHAKRHDEPTVATALHRNAPGPRCLRRFRRTRPQQPAKKGNNKQVAPPAPPEAWLKSDLWKDVPATPLEPGEIDQLLDKELQASKLPTAPLTTDEQFLRRVCLDLTGQLPKSDDIEKFVADKDPQKRAKLIDTLLDSDDYARHWAHSTSAIRRPRSKLLSATPSFRSLRNGYTSNSKPIASGARSSAT